MLQWIIYIYFKTRILHCTKPPIPIPPPTTSNPKIVDQNPLHILAPPESLHFSNKYLIHEDAIPCDFISTTQTCHGLTFHKLAWNLHVIYIKQLIYPGGLYQGILYINYATVASSLHVLKIHHLDRWYNTFSHHDSIWLNVWLTSLLNHLFYNRFQCKSANTMYHYVSIRN